MSNRSVVDLSTRTEPTQRRAQARRDSILSAMMELLDEMDISEVTTTLVAQRAGVPIGSVYRYFPNKYAMLAGLAARTMDQVDSSLEALYDNLAKEQPIAG